MNVRRERKRKLEQNTHYPRNLIIWRSKVENTWECFQVVYWQLHKQHAQIFVPSFLLIIFREIFNENFLTYFLPCFSFYFVYKCLMGSWRNFLFCYYVNLNESWLSGSPWAIWNGTGSFNFFCLIIQWVLGTVLDFWNAFKKGWGFLEKTSVKICDFWLSCC